MNFTRRLAALLVAVALSVTLGCKEKSEGSGGVQPKDGAKSNQGATAPEPPPEPPVRQK